LYTDLSHIGIYNLCCLAVIFAGLTLALLLGLAKKADQAANRYLSLALVIVLSVIAGMPAGCLLAIGPVIYFYVQRRIRPEHQPKKKEWLHFLPLLVAYWLPQWFAIVVILIYFFLSHRLIKNFYNGVQPVFMDKRRSAFRWIERMLMLLGLSSLIWSLTDIGGLSFALILGGMAAVEILKPGIVENTQPVQSPDRSAVREKARWLKEKMQAGRLYEDPELTLASLGEKLAIHPHELSRIVNQGLNKNFNDFVNELRIREVVRKMQDPAYDHLTLLGIAYGSGFNSKSTFNRIFKETTGKSPAEYKANLKKERPTYHLGRRPIQQPLILSHETIPQWSLQKLNGSYMFRNYLKIAFRNLWAKKAFSFINITGLAVGMAGAILIGLWVQNEYSFDSFHTNNKTLYKVWYRFVSKDYTGNSDITAGRLGNALKQEFPEIKNVSRIYWSENRLFNYKDVSLKAMGNEVDKDFLKMFTFPLTKGDSKHALDEASSIVLTQHLATKIFGEADPINQIIKLDDKQVYKVTGVMRDLPDNTQFNFEYLVPIPAAGAYNDNSWNSNSYYTYVQLQQNTNVDMLNQKIRLVVQKHVNDKNNNTEVFLYPFSKMHLYSRFENGKVVGGKIEVIRLLLIIAAIILLTACINFMNLSTAQSHKRAMEVGVRKVMGAGRLSLVSQFLAESMVITFIAGVAGLLVAQLGLPAFNQLTEKQLHIHYLQPVFWLLFIAFILLTGLLAGSYPAFFLSAFRPVKVLKGRFSSLNRAINPRKVLVVVQFAVAVVLIISTMVVYRQISYAQNRDVGYRMDHLVEVPVEGDIRKNFTLIKNDLVVSGAAISACETSIDVTIDGATGGGISTNGTNTSQQNINFSRFGTSGDFIKTMGLKLTGGRDLDLNEYPSDSASCMLNETAVKQLGIKDPLGTIIYQGNFPTRVVGVFKDFIINSPYVNTGPMIVIASKNWTYNSVVRLNGAKGTAADLKIAERIFKKYNPAYPFTYQFVDTAYQQKFNDQQQTARLAAIFAGLTIIISCLGLFGLASYMAESRSKEIGIRKVLGASVISITRMLTKEFVVLVLIAIIIAVPAALWATEKWLQDFTYRISVGWLTFVAAGLTAVIIAVLTVSFQSVKAAIANPVDSIRSE